MQVRHKPSVVLKPRRIERSRVPKSSDRIRCRKNRGRVYALLGMDTTEVIATQRDNIHTLLCRHDRHDDLACADIVLYAFVKMVDELTVALGHRDEWL